VSNLHVKKGHSYTFHEFHFVFLLKISYIFLTHDLHRWFPGSCWMYILGGLITCCFIAFSCILSLHYQCFRIFWAWLFCSASRALKIAFGYNSIYIQGKSWGWTGVDQSIHPLIQFKSGGMYTFLMHILSHFEGLNIRLVNDAGQYKRGFMWCHQGRKGLGQSMVW
jgi:hypothetical protein